MPDLLVIVSSKVFASTSADAKPGDVLALREYASTNPSLEGLREGGSLFLVTVRPPDERLWLLAELVDPKKGKTGWSAKPNVRPVTDITSLIGRIRFANGGAIKVEKGRLAMSLQTPRALDEKSAALLRGPSKQKSPAVRSKPAGKAASSAKKATKSPTKPTPSSKKATPPVAEDRIAAIVSGRMEQALVAVRELAGVADASVVPSILPWVDLDKWRSTEATTFWIYTFFLLMRFGEAKHLAALRRLPPHKNYSEMHRWLLRNRAFVADVIALRAKKKARPWKDEPLPKTRAKVMAHIDKRLGDPRWKPTKELVALVAKPPFSLHGEEGLRVFAALLLHGDPAELAPLKPLAKGEPMVAQVLSAHGASSPKAGEDRGELLRQSVLADPASDDCRAVYADWLMEQGDPRGELISAQLAGADPPIDARLALGWAGDVGTELRWRAPFQADKPFYTPRYRRGFLSGALVDSFDGRAASSRDWATLEVVDVDGYAIDRIGDYDLRSLLVLGNIHIEELPKVIACRKVAERLIGLGIALEEPSREAWELLRAFPRLRVLGVGCTGGLSSLFEHPIMKQIEVLAVKNGTRIPPVLQPRLTRLMTKNQEERWLPHFDRLVPFLAAPTKRR